MGMTGIGTATIAVLGWLDGECGVCYQRHGPPQSDGSFGGGRLCILRTWDYSTKCSAGPSVCCVAVTPSWVTPFIAHATKGDIKSDIISVLVPCWVRGLGCKRNCEQHGDTFSLTASWGHGVIVWNGAQRWVSSLPPPSLPECKMMI